MLADFVGHFIDMKKRKLKEEKISIRLEPETRRALEKMAAAEDKALSHFIRSELKKLVAAKKN